LAPLSACQIEEGGGHCLLRGKHRYRCPKGAAKPANCVSSGELAVVGYVNVCCD
jgi:hypothetical protein